MIEPSEDHRDTVDKILRHPASGNVEWREVERLLEALGATEENNGKLKVTLGGETEVFQPPRDKDIDTQMIVDLRHMLTKAGLDESRAQPFGPDEPSLAV